MIRKAVNSFKRMSDDGLVVNTQTAVDAMTANVDIFANPDPALADVQLALDDFTVKLAAARRRGSPVETSAKNDSRALLVELMRKLTFYVNNVAAGSLTVLLSSGFPLNQPMANGLPPDTPEGLRLREGRQKGQIRLDFGPVQTAVTYEYRYTDQLTADGQPIWNDRFHTTSSFNNVLAPVTAGRTYYVQVRALNSHGLSDWSYTLDYIGR